MAEKESTKAPSRAIGTAQHDWGTVHTGTRAALIAAGHAIAAEFPGEPGCGKTSTVFRAIGGGRKRRVLRHSTHLYEVNIYRTREERAAKKAEVDVWYNAERELYLREGQARTGLEALACGLRLVVDNDSPRRFK